MKYSRAVLFRKYAEVIEMQYETGISLRLFVKYGDETIDNPDFTMIGRDYSFALGILEGKPVFAGDTLYFEGGTKYLVDELSRVFTGLSWDKPEVDPYADLRKAQDAGRRIAMGGEGYWRIQNYRCEFNEEVKDYKIVEDDIVERTSFWTSFGKINIEITKEGLDGKLRVKLIDDC